MQMVVGAVDTSRTTRLVVPRAPRILMDPVQTGVVVEDGLSPAQKLM